MASRRAHLLAALAAALELGGCTCAPAPAPAPAGAAPATAGVRPAFRCVGAAAAPEALVSEAEAALDAGDGQRALGCADEALRGGARSVPALAARAEALALLGRPQEAALAFARALALDPDDPWTLAGAADLHARDLGGARDALEAGLALAERGLRAAARGHVRDADLRARLELAAAAALVDLGRAAEGLAHADRALALRPGLAAAVSERGLALFELCRFGEARAAFERALELQPGDPWALHQLGLLAERRGDLPAAVQLLGRARAGAPADFPPEVEISPQAFRAEVARAVAELPPAERDALRGVPVETADLPAVEDLTAVDPPLSPAILGLFRGPPRGEPCLPEDGDPCRSIVLYRKNLARFAAGRAELDRQLRVTLAHELGHLAGEDDEELRDRGLE